MYSVALGWFRLVLANSPNLMNPTQNRKDTDILEAIQIAFWNIQFKYNPLHTSFKLNQFDASNIVKSMSSHMLRVREISYCASKYKASAGE